MFQLFLFLQTKDREVDFDVEIAIKVCRQASTEDALLLAQKHKMHDWYLKIQIEDQGDCQQALEYIGKLDFSEVTFVNNIKSNIILKGVQFHLSFVSFRLKPT